MKMRYMIAPLFLSAGLALALQNPPQPASDVVTTRAPLTTAAQIKAALLTPGVYNIAAGTYTAHFTTTVPGVALMADMGVIFKTDDITKPVFQVTAGNFTLNGGRIEAGINEGIVIGSPTATDVTKQPDQVRIDGVTIVSPSNPTSGGGSRGIAVHGSNVTITHCRIEGYWRPSQEVQAIWVHNGPGPITITDNYLEGAGENILFGGSGVPIVGLVPSDIYVARNHFYKPDRWRPASSNSAACPECGTQPATVKNIFELKNARRVLIEDNDFDGNWKSGQAGIPIVFTVRNSDGKCSWCEVNDVVFRHNRVHRAFEPGAYAVNILGHDDGGRASAQTQRITIEDNLFEDSPGGVQVGSGVTDKLIIRHNTWPKNVGTFVGFVNSSIKTGCFFDNNAGQYGVYNYFLSGVGDSLLALNAACNPGYSSTGNVFVKMHTHAVTWPPGNTIFPIGTVILSGSPNYTLVGPAAGMDAGWTP